MPHGLLIDSNDNSTTQTRRDRNIVDGGKLGHASEGDGRLNRWMGIHDHQRFIEM